MLGIEGHPITMRITIPLLVEVGPHLLYHQFVIKEGRPINLLGRDLQEKLQAGVMFRNQFMFTNPGKLQGHRSIPGKRTPGGPQSCSPPAPRSAG